MSLKKRFVITVITIAISFNLFSQEVSNVTDWVEEGKSLYEGISGKENEHKNINIDLHLRAGFDLDMLDSKTSGKFNMREARIDIKGNLTDWLSFRYRQKLNEGNSSSGNIDNLPASLDVLGLGIKFSDKWSTFIGKQAVSYGGFEYDLNPIMVYDYSETLLSLYGFMTGVNVIYNVNKSHELQFQIVNSRMRSNIDETYGPGFKDVSLPFIYTLNWNGNFNDTFLTRWSASLMSQAKGKQAYYYTMGNQLNIDKFSMYLDLNYYTKDIDDNGVITTLTGGIDGHNALNVDYKGIVYQIDYRMTPKWNIFCRTSFDATSVNKSHEDIEKGTYKTLFGYQTGVEYYPMQKSNLHFFLAYVGKYHKFKKKAKSFEADNYSENRVSVGFIYTLPVF